MYFSGEKDVTKSKHERDPYTVPTFAHKTSVSYKFLSERVCRVVEWEQTLHSHRQEYTSLAVLQLK